MAQQKYLTDREASAWLKELGIRRAPGTLKRLRCQGLGPRFVYVGKLPRHTPELLGEYVRSIVSQPVTSTLARSEITRAQRVLIGKAAPDVAQQVGETASVAGGRDARG